MRHRQANPSGVGKRGLCLILAMLILTPAPAAAKELKPKTIATYDRYVTLTEARIAGELESGKPFLWFDRVPQAARDTMLADLSQGKVLIESLKTLEANGKEFKVSDGMIHHWAGLVHVPGVTLQQVLALVQDYDSHGVVYKPDVVRSKTVQHDGDAYKIFYRFYKHKVIGVTLNTDHDVFYQNFSEKRVISRSYTTRIAEVENPGKKEEKEKPVGNDGGFMWRLHTWWRIEERDGGVYVQCETVSLSRDIPFGFGWIIGPFVKSVPKESLQFTLGTTRAALLAPQASATRQ